MDHEGIIKIDKMARRSGKRMIVMNTEKIFSKNSVFLPITKMW